jgi:hypothetical protein
LDECFKTFILGETGIIFSWQAIQIARGQSFTVAAIVKSHILGSLGPVLILGSYPFASFSLFSVLNQDDFHFDQTIRHEIYDLIHLVSFRNPGFRQQNSRYRQVKDPTSLSDEL